MKKRSLNACQFARIKGDHIYCQKGHKLGKNKDGSMSILPFKREAPLEYEICQECQDFKLNTDEDVRLELWLKLLELCDEKENSETA